jgi:hypothetical protein
VLITEYKILLIILVSFIAIVLILKHIKLGCYLGYHGWKNQESKIPDDPSHAYLFRECKKCPAFQTKNSGSNYKWKTIGRGIELK